MADLTFAIGFQTSQGIRLMVVDIFERLEEEAFKYLNEILAIAKKTFKSSKIELLPKTPSAKQSRRKVPRRKIDEVIEEDEDNNPPSKRLSLHPEADNTRDDFASPKKDTRVTRAATRAATTSRAKKKSTMDSRRQKNQSKKNKSSPIVCIEKLVQQETLELETKVTTENNNSCLSPIQKQSKQSYGSQKSLQNICLMNVKTNTHAYKEMIHINESDAGHQSNKTPSKRLEKKPDTCSNYRSGSIRRSSRNRKVSHLDTPKASRRSSRASIRKSLKTLKSHQALKKSEKFEKTEISDEKELNDEGSNTDVTTDDESHDEDEVVPRSPSSTAAKIIHPASFLNSLNKNTTNSALRSANLASTIVRSFIKRNTPPLKPTMENLQDKKKKAFEEKERLHQERLKTREKQYQKKMEEVRRKREEKMKKVIELREKRHVEESKTRMLLNKRMQQKEQLVESLREDRLREEREKQKIRQQKLQEAEERRFQDQNEWENKLRDQQEEEKRHQELLQKKKEIDEFERQQKVQEENQKLKDKLAEFEKEREAETEKLRQIEEEKEREWQKKKEEREKMLAQERAEKERIELEKKREKELQMKKELEKQKELEKKRFDEEEQQMEKERQREEDLKKQLNKHNVQVMQQQQQQDTITQGIPKPNLNRILTLTEPQITSTSNPNSYEMTPVRMRKKSPSEDNYDISDLHSGDSTDNEDAPRKIIPLWAQGVNLKAALINQHYHPPNLERMFPYIEPPDLNVFFEKKRARFNKRTSSAHWDSPILPPYKI